ncbi:hypothetical protein [Desulfitobacterium sp. AusDCA]|uniref:hypothetical protein n=1 Tax=Desulfitobacterium sp. AusDCA TaxID=3240383 RepID=UPI003DA79C4D
MEKKLNQLNNEMRNKIINKIQGFSVKERYNLCAECHKVKGCGIDHSVYLYDTGTCDLCGKKGDVVNCSLAGYLKEQDIDEIIYWEAGLPRIIQKRIN